MSTQMHCRLKVQNVNVALSALLCILNIILTLYIQKMILVARFTVVNHIENQG